ncbi:MULTISPECIES: hypothetical protein [Neorhizobium]|uniref:Uncharacterized protein n=1 Tax=Neorhizobium galegae bv. officinalis TaxID=323656 RepID=A0A0T7GRQ4_NEOGA|nr:MULTISPECIES: hypothetical protein [Neorhizobium]KAB1125632.1 hypothetical protein F4V90_00435 [Neorhizobium galegae]MCQ1805891.1 hypothetical protein [Neorhizobium galegae]CDZ49942.1 Hypothetical protein NGAL_HAMBI1189_32020 [Neorhizobium galegae bv. officinalis]CDZ59469.1 Hypothetical protein NGAL_HAMBI2566_35230 [Neorhizobium galegae bv. orientalis]
MNSALIVMTILGCNDAGTDCHYIATAENRWPSIELCNSVSEQQLSGYANQPYPMLIAVCQKPEAAEIANAPVPRARPETPPPAPAGQPAATLAQEPVTQQEKETLAGRAIQRVKTVLPTTEGVKTLMTSPVRLVENGYSWVAKRFER